MCSEVPASSQETFELKPTSVKRVMRAALGKDGKRGRGVLVGEQAVKLMSRACELLCKDMSKRGEIVMRAGGK